MILHRFQKLEMPNGAKFDEIFEKGGKVPPELIDEIQDSVRRKQAQLKMITDELGRIADDAKSAAASSQEMIRQIQVVRDSGTNDLSEKIIGQRWSELPAEIQMSVAQSVTAERLQILVNYAQTKLEVLSKLTGALQELPEKTGWIQRWRQKNEIKKKFDEVKDVFK